MSARTAYPLVFAPESLTEALNWLARNDEAIINAGGTWLHRDQQDRLLTYRSDVLHLGRIEELRRISRSERFLEIGATVTVEQLLRVGRTILPGPLKDALKGIGPPPLRHLATIGGNLCVTERRMDLFPVLYLMDARLEIRRTRRRGKRMVTAGRWVPVHRFLKPDGTLDLEKNEILTRIRLPEQRWNHGFYRRERFGGPESREELLVTVLAETGKGLLEDFRLALSVGGRTIFRDREKEGYFLGRKLPLTGKDRDAFLGWASRLDESFPDKPFQIRLAGNWMKQILTGLNEPAPETRGVLPGQEG